MLFLKRLPTKTSFGPDWKKQFYMPNNDLQKLVLERKKIGCSWPWSLHFRGFRKYAFDFLPTQLSPDPSHRRFEPISDLLPPRQYTRFRLTPPPLDSTQ